MIEKAELSVLVSKEARRGQITDYTAVYAPLSQVLQIGTRSTAASLHMGTLEVDGQTGITVGNEFWLAQVVNIR
jgi:hypothetical protein